MGHFMLDKQFLQRLAASLIVAWDHKRGASGECHDELNYGYIEAEG